LKMVENAAKSFLDFAQEEERPDVSTWILYIRKILNNFDL
jgi:hypothetical protein